MNSLFYTAAQVAEMLGVSKQKAYKIISEMNEELEQKGFLVIRGRISKKYFENRFYVCGEGEEVM